MTVFIANIFIVVPYTVLVCGCSEQRAPAPVNRPEPPPLNACALLTPDEIARIQGAALQSATPSERTHNGIPVAQCSFRLPTAADSLNLAVYRPPGGSGEETPAKLWRAMFHDPKPQRVGRDGNVKEGFKPQKIEALGDEAFWTGGQFGGMLQVLKGETSFQLSVGGPGDQAAKVEQLKELAKLIMSRL